MADRVELLKAMRVIKEHCNSIPANHCHMCPLEEQCECEPCNWYLEDGEENEDD